MFRCIADPEILLIDGKESIETKKRNLQNFFDFLKSTKTIYSYEGYNEDITKNLAKSINYIKKNKNKEYQDLEYILNDIEQIKENFFEMHEIITDYAVKNFKQFLNLIEKKFSNRFIDFILTNSDLNSIFKVLKSNERGVVTSFFAKNLAKTRDIGYVLSKSNKVKHGLAQVRNFKDFDDIVLNNLGFNDLSVCDIYIVQPDILNTLYVHSRTRDKVNLKIFLNTIINYFIDKFSSTSVKPVINFFADQRVGDPKNFNIDILKKKFKEEFIETFKNDINLKIHTINWSKKSEAQSRLFYSSNYHGFSFNRGFDFFIEGEYGSKDRDSIIYSEAKTRNQLKVEERESRFFENTDKKYLNLLKSLFSLKNNPINEKNLETLKIFKKRMLKKAH